MTQQVLKEKRSRDRHAIPLFVYEQATDRLLGCAENIHLEGLMLVSKQAVPVKTEIPILLEIPGQDVKVRISLNSFTAWTSISDSRPTFYYTGFYFVSPSHEAIAHIQTLIDELSEQAV